MYTESFLRFLSVVSKSSAKSFKTNFYFFSNYVTFSSGFGSYLLTSSSEYVTFTSITFYLLDSYQISITLKIFLIEFDIGKY